MTNNKSKVAIVLASTLLAVASVATAKTPDGDTPAIETICNQFSGALFGLCNAYCEAQDLDEFPKDPVNDVLENNFEKKGGGALVCSSNPEL